MLVAELTAPREFRLAQQEIEEPQPGEVQVRVDSVGLCGSDLHSYTEGGVGDTPCQYPMILGHEPAGTVVAVGAGVTGCPLCIATTANSAIPGGTTSVPTSVF
jgi:L-iditol 2-dehydrogenase